MVIFLGDGSGVLLSVIFLSVNSAKFEIEFCFGTFVYVIEGVDEHDGCVWLQIVI